MARLKATDFKGLDTLLGMRREIVIGHETTASRSADGMISVSLFGNEIVRLHPDTVTMSFTLADWPTVTTRERINQFLPRRWAVGQHRKRQYLSDRTDWSRSELAPCEWVTLSDRECLASRVWEATVKVEV